MSKIKLNAASGGGSVSFEGPTSSGNDKVIKLPAAPGCIVQVVQTVKTDPTSHDTNTWTDISGMSVSITPTSASSKILVNFHGSGSTVNLGYIRLLRDSTEIGSGGSAGSRIPVSCMFHRSGDSNLMESFGNSYLDSPNTTSAVTYKLQWRDESGTIYLNRSVSDTDSAAGIRTSSVITAMEVAG